jgi:hypothetical protein
MQNRKTPKNTVKNTEKTDTTDKNQYVLYITTRPNRKAYLEMMTKETRKAKCFMKSLMHFEKNTRKQQNNDTQQKKITFCPSYTKEK